MVRLKQLYSTEETYPLTMTPFHFRFSWSKNNTMNSIFRFFKKLKETKKRNEAFRKEYKNKTGEDFHNSSYDSDIGGDIPI